MATRVVEAHLVAVRVAADEQDPLDRFLLPERRTDTRLETSSRGVHDRHNPTTARGQLREQLIDLVLYSSQAIRQRCQCPRK